MCPQKPVFPSGPSRRAFSLIELLTVIAIVGTLAAVSLPLGSQFSGSTNSKKNVLMIAQILEHAKLSAVSRNTYIWVGFRETTTADGSPALEAITVESQSGADTLQWAGQTVMVGDSSGLRLAGRPVQLDRVVLKPQGAVTFAGLPGLPNGRTPVELCGVEGASPLVLRLSGPNGNRDFDKLIQFTPSGHAKVAMDLAEAVEFGIQPARGNQENTNQPSVFRIPGLTGKVQVYSR